MSGTIDVTRPNERQVRIVLKQDPPSTQFAMTELSVDEAIAFAIGILRQCPLTLEQASEIRSLT